MNDIRFCKSFGFRLFRHRSNHHTDNSGGIDCHFIGRMRRGSARIVTLSGEELTLRAGDVFYLPLGLRYHSYWTVEKEHPVEWESYRFTYLPLPADIRLLPQRLFVTEEERSLLDRLSVELTVSPTTVGWLYLFLGQVLPRMVASEPNPKEALLRKAVDYISAHSDLRVSELARHCSMSESGLYAFFRQYAGATPIEVKNRIVTERAVSLLESTDLSVEEISDRLGFCSSAYFRKIVKQQTGKTPTQLRKEARLI